MSDERETLPQFDAVSMGNLSVLRHLSNNVLRDKVEQQACAWAVDEIERLTALLDPCPESTRGLVRVERCRLRAGHIGSHMSQSGTKVWSRPNYD